MKHSETNVTTVNQSNQVQAIAKSDKCHLIQMVEKRYGVKFLQEMFTCKEIYKGYGQTPDWMYFEFMFFSNKNDIRGIKTEFYLADLSFCNLEELYRITNTMDYSNQNYKNSINWNQNNPMAYLIPIIQIKFNKKTLAFRFDNQIITEMFKDTHAIVSGNLTQEEILEINERQKHQMEYLNYTYSDTEYKRGCCNWNQLYWEKYYLGKSDMLHSEYLEWKSVNLK